MPWQSIANWITGQQHMHRQEPIDATVSLPYGEMDSDIADCRIEITDR